MQDIHLGMREDVDWQLLNAARAGNLAKVEDALNKGADIETRDYEEGNDAEYTPLHHACDKGHKDVVERLLERGAKVDALTSIVHRTPLHYACMEGHLEVVKLLIGKGADMNKTTSTGGTPQHCAARAGHLSIVKYLLEEMDANMHVRDKDGLTLLHSAAASGNVALVEYLQKYYQEGEGLKQKTNKQCTPLHFSAWMGHIEVVELLVKYDPTLVNLQDTKGNTLLYYAEKKGHKVVADFLKGKANPEQAMPYEELSRKRESYPSVPHAHLPLKRSKHVDKTH